MTKKEFSFSSFSVFFPLKRVFIQISPNNLFLFLLDFFLFPYFLKSVLSYPSSLTGDFF